MALAWSRNWPQGSAWYTDWLGGRGSCGAPVGFCWPQYYWSVAAFLDFWAIPCALCRFGSEGRWVLALRIDGLAYCSQPTGTTWDDSATATPFQVYSPPTGRSCIPRRAFHSCSGGAVSGERDMSNFSGVGIAWLDDDCNLANLPPSPPTDGQWAPRVRSVRNETACPASTQTLDKSSGREDGSTRLP